MQVSQINGFAFLDGHFHTATQFDWCCSHDLIVLFICAPNMVVFHFAMLLYCSVEFLHKTVVRIILHLQGDVITESLKCWA
jgi:hypothetical protein